MRCRNRARQRGKKQDAAFAASCKVAGMKRIDWLRLLILSLVWGGSFIFFRILAAQLPPMTTVFFRVAIGALAVLGFMRLEGSKFDAPRSEWPKLALLGLVNCVLPFCFYAWGETRVSAGLASIINATTPMFTVAIAGLIMRNEAMTGLRVIGVLCGIVGVTVVVGPDVLVGADPLGELVCLLAPFCYGWAFQVARRVKGLNPASMAAGQLLFASLELLPLVLIFDQPWNLPAPTMSGWLRKISGSSRSVKALSHASMPFSASWKSSELSGRRVGRYAAAFADRCGWCAGIPANVACVCESV